MCRLGGTERVAARSGGVRICSLGRLILSRSADFVSRRRKLGTLGRLGGAGRRKESCEGGGEGSESNAAGVDELVDIAAGIMGIGECTKAGRSCSSSGMGLDREAASVFN